MAGTPEKEEPEIPKKVKETIRFGVDEKKARVLLGCSAVLASEMCCQVETEPEKNPISQG